MRQAGALGNSLAMSGPVSKWVQHSLRSDSFWAMPHCDKSDDIPGGCTKCCHLHQQLCWEQPLTESTGVRWSGLMGMAT